MRASKAFGKTLRHTPAEAELDSHRLMLRAGMIHRTAAGVYSYMPLAWRSIRKIEEIIREEMDAAGGQELHMSKLQPRELWERSGRYEAYGPDLMRLSDRRERGLVLAPTHEELLTTIVKANVHSYRDLPAILYQIQTKFRDEPRPRGGLIRVREFDMKDAYSFDADQDGLDKSYAAMSRAYHRIFERCGLDAIVVDADSGAIGGKDSQEFVLLADAGEDTIIVCGGCEYAANAEKAEFRKPPQPAEEPQPIEEVHTPGVKTIEELADFMGVPAAKTLKAVFYAVDGELAFVVIRGDLEVNEIKLSNALGNPSELRLASAGEVAAAGVVAGSASPVGIDVRVIADDSATLGSNFLAGANRDGYHLKGVNFPRDFSADILTDVALARSGCRCARCGATMNERRGIEIGHVFKLGTRYSEVLEARHLDPSGELRPIIMGCYGIGVERLLAAAIEASHDENGIIFPPAIAPYDVHLVALNTNVDEAREAADSLYDNLQEAGLSVLYDDRNESAGVKFNDADLIGLPVRVVSSRRNLRQGVVEVKRRDSADAETVATADAAAKVGELLGRAHAPSESADSRRTK